MKTYLSTVLLAFGLWLTLRGLNDMANFSIEWWTTLAGCTLAAMGFNLSVETILDRMPRHES